MTQCFTIPCLSHSSSSSYIVVLRHPSLILHFSIDGLFSLFHYLLLSLQQGCHIIIFLYKGIRGNGHANSTGVTVSIPNANVSGKYPIGVFIMVWYANISLGMRFAHVPGSSSPTFLLLLPFFLLILPAHSLGGDLPVRKLVLCCFPCKTLAAFFLWTVSHCLWLSIVAYDVLEYELLHLFLVDCPYCFRFSPLCKVIYSDKQVLSSPRDEQEWSYYVYSPSFEWNHSYNVRHFHGRLPLYVLVSLTLMAFASYVICLLT